MNPKMVQRLEELSERIRVEHLTPRPWPRVDVPYSVAAEGYFHDLHFLVLLCDRRPTYSKLGLPLSENGAPEIHYNGYVELPAHHPDFGKWYEDIEAEVHGGLTFCQLSDKGTFWVGFDTIHLADENQWPLERVISETEALAVQLAEKMK